MAFGHYNMDAFGGHHPPPTRSLTHKVHSVFLQQIHLCTDTPGSSQLHNFMIFHLKCCFLPLRCSLEQPHSSPSTDRSTGEISPNFLRQTSFWIVSNSFLRLSIHSTNIYRAPAMWQQLYYTLSRQWWTKRTRFLLSRSQLEDSEAEQWIIHVNLDYKSWWCYEKELCAMREAERKTFRTEEWMKNSLSSSRCTSQMGEKMVWSRTWEQPWTWPENSWEVRNTSRQAG